MFSRGTSIAPLRVVVSPKRFVYTSEAAGTRTGTIRVWPPTCVRVWRLTTPANARTQLNIGPGKSTSWLRFGMSRALEFERYL